MAHPVHALTPAQALALLAIWERDDLKAKAPCPDLLQWVRECRAAISAPLPDHGRLDEVCTFGVHLADIEADDGGAWCPGSVVEYGPGLMAVPVWVAGDLAVLLDGAGSYVLAKGAPDSWVDADPKERAFDTLADAALAMGGAACPAPLSLPCPMVAALGLSSGATPARPCWKPFPGPWPNGSTPGLIRY